MFRLKQKHSRKRPGTPTTADAASLIGAQSLVRALAAAVGMLFLMSWVWAYSAESLGRVFTWFSIVQGAAVGYAVQRFGRGLDWRFPVVAAVVAWIGAYSGSLMIGVITTGRYIEAGTMEVIRGLSADTMEMFFRDTINPVVHIYAVFAAGVAAFFANRRLKRHEVLALRRSAEAGE